MENREESLSNNAAGKNTDRENRTDIGTGIDSSLDPMSNSMSHSVRTTDREHFQTMKSKEPKSVELIVLFQIGWKCRSVC